MPYKNPKRDRNYKKEYELFLADGGREEQSERQRARRAFDKEHGREARRGKALDHIKPIKDGGKSNSDNVRLKDFGENSSRNFKSPKSSR
jgi:hypothetical protein